MTKSTPIQKKKMTTPVSTPVSVPVSVPVDVPVSVSVDVDVSADVDGDKVPDSEILKKLAEYSEMLQISAINLSRAKAAFKYLERLVVKQQKSHLKALMKKNKRLHKPSGFTKPSLISDEMAEFIGAPQGSCFSRTDVAKVLNEYINTHSLKDKKNGRNINADKKLSKLLNLKADDNLSYFNLQKYIKHHFIKDPASVVPVVVAV
jgi:hypothetical protein